MKHNLRWMIPLAILLTLLAGWYFVAHADRGIHQTVYTSADGKYRCIVTHYPDGHTTEQREDIPHATTR